MLIFLNKNGSFDVKGGHLFTSPHKFASDRLTVRSQLGHERSSVCLSLPQSVHFQSDFVFPFVFFLSTPRIAFCLNKLFTASHLLAANETETNKQTKDRQRQTKRQNRTD